MNIQSVKVVGETLLPKLKLQGITQSNLLTTTYGK